MNQNDEGREPGQKEKIFLMIVILILAVIALWVFGFKTKCARADSIPQKKHSYLEGWEPIGDPGRTTTYRMAVPNGWLIEYRGNRPVFIEDKSHEWTLE